jgi:hypothetical protein
MLTECMDPTELVGILHHVRDAEQAAFNAKAEVDKLKTKFATLGADVATLTREHNKDLQNAYKKMKQKVGKIESGSGPLHSYLKNQRLIR